MRSLPRLTVGMACYDDFNGVYFSVQALQLYHAAWMPEIEFLIVDNNPTSREGETTRDFIQSSVPGGRYLACEEISGTAAPRDRVFREAAGELVLCIDSHVLLAPGAIGKLLEYYAAHPETKDLLQGPLLRDDGKSVSTHMEPRWNDAMFGVWGSDPRGQEIDAEPFEIPMHGCGLMSCRKAVWPGFHPDFRGFGGEEGYLHEKFRQTGGVTRCLPFLRWMHRFGRPAGTGYSVTHIDRLRNYLLGRLELGQPIHDVQEHLYPRMSRYEIDQVLHDVGLPTLTEQWIEPRGLIPQAAREHRRAARQYAPVD